jgi:hypothetical protein
MFLSTLFCRTPLLKNGCFSILRFSIFITIPFPDERQGEIAPDFLILGEDIIVRERGEGFEVIEQKTAPE